ncbi:MAG: hypothetical protein ABFQ53_02755, partial [Patescibacteria group bacterium]
PSDTEACDPGVFENWTENSSVFTWNCNERGDVCKGSKSCSADCVTLEIKAPEFKYLKKSGDDKFDVQIILNDHRNIENGSVCTIKAEGNDERTVEINGQSSYTEANFDLQAPSTIIDVSCELKIDCSGTMTTTGTKTLTASKIVKAMCTQKECNAQGSCQATPKEATNYSDCKKTCNSDADCRKGRMIETKP